MQVRHGLDYTQEPAKRTVTKMIDKILRWHMGYLEDKRIQWNYSQYGWLWLAFTKGILFGAFLMWII